MLLGEPQTTPYDLHFQLLGIRVRISPWFWLVATFLGWNLISNPPPTYPAPAILLIMWISSVYFTILVHEMGHAMAFRYYGIDSHIVLYHFGGLAIPDSGPTGFGARIDPKAQIIISAAGPAAPIERENDLMKTPSQELGATGNDVAGSVEPLSPERHL